jgi:group II intron reverse transcriptase/maturase
MAWETVKANRGSGGVDGQSLERFAAQRDQQLDRLQSELKEDVYRPQPVRQVQIPKVGKPGEFRTLGIPTVKDRTVQMAVKLVIEPLFEADFVPCSFGFRPEKTPRMALSIIAEKTQAGYTHVVDVDLKSYFDTIDHELLMQLVGRRVGDVRVLRLIRAWLKAGVLEEGKVTQPDRGCSPTSFLTKWIVSGVAAMAR